MFSRLREGLCRWWIERGRGLFRRRCRRLDMLCLRISNFQLVSPSLLQEKFEVLVRKITFLISSVPNKLLNILESIADTAIVLLATKPTLRYEDATFRTGTSLRLVEVANLLSVCTIMICFCVTIERGSGFLKLQNRSSHFLANTKEDGKSIL